MADYRALCKRLLLADGRVGDREFALVKDEFLANHRLGQDEFEFLLELRRAARSVPPEFNRLLFDALKRHVLKDGTVRAAEADWLRRFVLADGRIDDAERQFLRDLRAAAREAGPEFAALCREAGAA